MGCGLKLQKNGSLSKRPPFEILVAKMLPTGGEELLVFKPFEELAIAQKLSSLKNLSIATLVEFDHAKHQIDFLVDDVRETTFDSKNDTDLLYRLSEMYHCVVNINGI